MSRRGKLRLIPSHLPLVQSRLAQFERGQMNATIAGLRADVVDARRVNVDAFFRDVDMLESAPLMWVSEDMVKLSEDTADAGDFPTVPPPSSTGLVFFEHDIQHIVSDVTDDDTGEVVGQALITALLWECDADGRILRLMPYTDFPLALRDTGAAQAGLPVIYHDRRAWRDFDAGRMYAERLLRAVWALSEQPNICEARPATQNARYPLPARFDQAISRVKMIVLRENLHRPGESGEDDERVRREYSHRFIVRGFWRNQAYGPNHSFRRRQWIPPFVKGPADKPLVCKDTVRIWRH